MQLRAKLLCTLASLHKERQPIITVPEFERQLRLLRAYAVLTYPFACVPFLFFFFSQQGLDLAGYGKVVALYYVVMFIADVPTSLLADRLGRRAMMVLGPMVLALGFVVLFYWRNCTGFCVGEGLMGLGHSILSGPPSAILYDLLRRNGQQHRYLHHESRIHALRLLGTGCSFLLGGGLAYAMRDGDSFAFAATILPTAFLCVLAGLIAMRLRSAPPPALTTFRSLVKSAKEDLRHREVRWLLAYWIVLFALLRFPFHNYQPCLVEASAREPLLRHPLLIGTLFGLLNLVAAPLSSKVPALVQRFGRRPLFWGMPILLAISLLLMALENALAAQWPAFGRPLAWLGVSLFFLQQIPFGMHWALVQEFVNDRIGPEARATVWSVLSLGGRLAYAPLNAWLFFLQQSQGLTAVLFGAGLGGLALTIAVMTARPRGLLRGRGRVA